MYKDWLLCVRTILSWDWCLTSKILAQNSTVYLDGSIRCTCFRWLKHIPRVTVAHFPSRYKVDKRANWTQRWRLPWNWGALCRKKCGWLWSPPVHPDQYDPRSYIATPFCIRAKCWAALTQHRVSTHQPQANLTTIGCLLKTRPVTRWWH